VVYPRKTWKSPRVRFNVRRHGIVISRYPLPDGVDPGITYNTSFAEWEAARAAGLDLRRWDTPGGYPASFMAKVIAWYTAHNLVKAHTQAAMNQKLASKTKGGAK